MSTFEIGKVQDLMAFHRDRVPGHVRDDMRYAEWEYVQSRRRAFL